MPTQLSSASPVVFSSNLHRLMLLRGVALIGGAMAAVFSVTWLDADIPVLLILAVILGLGIMNVVTWRRLKRPAAIKPHHLYAQLVIDAMALTAVLYFSGGANNPFTLLYLLPLTVTALAMPGPYTTWGMVIITNICYASLMFYPDPASGPAPVHQHIAYSWHAIGMWIGFILSSCLIAYFSVGMTRMLKQRDRMLNQAREQANRDRQLVALGTLAAGAAHELGTPLATMAIVTNELCNDYSGNADIVGRANLLNSQIKRCKESLSVISAKAGQSQAESGRLVHVDELLERLGEDLLTLRPHVKLKIRFDGKRPAPEILGDLTLNHAIANILGNAADASPDDVTLFASWTTADLLIEISDRGEGVSSQEGRRLGKALFSARQDKGGMGIGAYLAYGTFTRLGGDVQLFHRDGGGTCTRIIIPLKYLTIDEAEYGKHFSVIQD